MTFLVFVAIMSTLLKEIKMKKMLLALFSVLFIGLYVSSASAEHNGVPTVGQVRTEVVWFCDNINDARTYVTAREKVESYDDWILVLRALVSLGNCRMDEIEYRIDEIVETISGLYVEKGRTFGEPVTHYIIDSGGLFFVTY